MRRRKGSYHRARVRCSPLVVVAVSLAPLALAVSCGPSNASGAGGHAATSASGAGGGGEQTACAACLAVKCAAQKSACSDECYALQACIDAVCFNLSATAAPDEGACQVYCQNLHPEGQIAQRALVDCAQSEPVVAEAGATCMPPCEGAPLDFDACSKNAVTTGCAAASAACSASPDCVAYRACAGACTTLSDCQACATTSQGSAGEPLFEALQVCIAHSCLAEEWLPHF